MVSEGMLKAEELCKMAWILFCNTYPKFIEKLSGIDLKRYKSAWLVGYYFSLSPSFKKVRMKITDLLEKEDPQYLPL